MTALDETPENVNYLSPHNFLFQIKKTPNLNYNVQNVNLPGVSIDPPFQHTPFVKIPKSGEHIHYDDIMINYLVDERLKNYLEIHNWLKALGFPDTYEQFEEIQNADPQTGEGLMSDISLFVLDSDRRPIYDVRFKDAFPVSSSSIIFDSTSNAVAYLVAAATFKYRSYDIFPL